MLKSKLAVTYADIAAAAQRLEGVVLTSQQEAMRIRNIWPKVRTLPKGIIPKGIIPFGIILFGMI